MNPDAPPDGRYVPFAEPASLWRVEGALPSTCDFCPEHEDTVTDRTITLSEGECVDVTAALELLINHCDAFNGPANPFAARRENCEALLKKLRAASLGPRVH